MKLNVFCVCFTGRNIFELMDKELKARDIPWENCLSLGCDNASVMTGHKKGIIFMIIMSTFQCVSMTKYLYPFSSLIYSEI